MSEDEARPSGGSPQASGVTVSDIQELIRRKEEIEAQIKANYDVLESVSVGSVLLGGVAEAPQGLRTRLPDLGGLGVRGGPRWSPQLWLPPSLGGPRRHSCGLCRQQEVRQIGLRTEDLVGITAEACGALTVYLALFHVMYIGELI